MNISNKYLNKKSNDPKKTAITRDIAITTKVMRIVSSFVGQLTLFSSEYDSWI